MQSKLNLPSLPTFPDGESVNLRKINFFFGKNGTGKSTIVSYIKDNPHSLKDQEQTLLVYDSKFKQDIRTSMPGIYTFGSGNAELLSEKKQLNSELENLTDESKQLNDEKISKEEDYKIQHELIVDKVWIERASLIKEFGEDWSSGFNNNKNNMATMLLKNFEEYESNTTTYERMCQLKLLLTADESTTLEKQPTINCEQIDTDIFVTSIVSFTKSELNDYYRKLNNEDWVKKGRGFQQGAICPYCMQSLPSDFEERFNKVFDEAYNEKINTLYQTIQQLQSFYEHIEKITNNTETNTLEDYDYSPLEKQKKVLLSKVNNNRSKCMAKNNAPSEKIHLDQIDDDIDEYNRLIDSLNIQIEKHNNDVSNLKSLKNELKNAVWGCLARKCHDDIFSFRETDKKWVDDKEKLDKQIQANYDKISTIDEKIKKINAQMTDISKTVDDINKMLRSYGFTSFRLDSNKPQNGTYRVVREDGSDAMDTLSEGEFSLIAFLYFFFTIRGSRDPQGANNRKIVVIDDPVNSMDGDVIYIITAAIRTIILGIIDHDQENNIDQLLLFTHNVYFHKELSFLNGKKIYYHHIKKIEDKSWIDSQERSTIVSNYLLLWQEYIQSNNPVTLFNVMRRILQHFFENIIGLERYKEIRNYFNGADGIQLEKLICELDSGSHTIWDPVECNIDDKEIKQLKQIFKEVFEKLGYGSHYDLMTSQVQMNKSANTYRGSIIFLRNAISTAINIQYRYISLKAKLVHYRHKIIDLKRQRFPSNAQLKPHIRYRGNLF